MKRRLRPRQDTPEPPHHFLDFNEMQEVIKMPIDLVAKALNQTSEDASKI